MSANKANLTQQGFKDAPFFDPNLSIIIGGVGGIGSNVNYNLCRLNYETYIYDFDNIEIHNIGSQLFSVNDVGKSKAEVAKEVAIKYGNTNSIHLMGRFTEESLVGNIVFSCFDNMAARKLMFNSWKEFQLSKTEEYRKENPEEVNIFLDGRMYSEGFQIFAVRSKKQIETYEKTLFDDSEAFELPCSFKATCHTGTMIGGLMTTLFLNQVVNKKEGIEAREVPFYIQYDNALMLYQKMNTNEYISKKLE